MQQSGSGSSNVAEKPVDTADRLLKEGALHIFHSGICAVVTSTRLAAGVAPGSAGNSLAPGVGTVASLGEGVGRDSMVGAILAVGVGRRAVAPALSVGISVAVACNSMATVAGVTVAGVTVAVVSAVGVASAVPVAVATVASAVSVAGVAVASVAVASVVTSVVAFLALLASFATTLKGPVVTVATVATVATEAAVGLSLLAVAAVGLSSSTVAVAVVLSLMATIAAVALGLLAVATVGLLRTSPGFDNGSHAGDRETLLHFDFI